MAQLPDGQMGRIVQAIILPDAWMDRVLARIHLADEIKRIEEERRRVEQRLKRLGKAYVDGLYGDEDYKREKRFLEERAASLVIPGIDVAREAGKLLEDLPTLWQEANLSERHKLLHTMLDAVYVDTVEEKAIVALKPKPAFQALFQIATTLESSGVILYKENPPDQFPSPEDNSPCFWWRRGRLAPAITKFFIQKHCGEQRRIYRLRLYRYEILAVYRDFVKNFPDKTLPLFVTNPRMKPEGR